MKSRDEAAPALFATSHFPDFLLLEVSHTSPYCDPLLIAALSLLGTIPFRGQRARCGFAAS